MTRSCEIIETLFIPAMALFSIFHYSRWCEGEVIYHWFQGLLRLAQTILQCHSCCWKATICWFKAAVCLDTFQRKRTRCCIKEDTAAYFTISSFLYEDCFFPIPLGFDLQALNKAVWEIQTFSSVRRANNPELSLAENSSDHIGLSDWNRRMPVPRYAQ